MVCVLDSSAVIAYLAREQGRDVVERYLDSGDCLVHAVNYCEVIYHLLRQRTTPEVDGLLNVLEASGVARREDLDPPFLRMVAAYKVAPGPTALGDCFGLAPAERLRLPFVTADRHELTRVAARGTVAIDFIR